MQLVQCATHLPAVAGTHSLSASKLEQHHLVATVQDNMEWWTFFCDLQACVDEGTVLDSGLAWPTGPNPNERMAAILLREQQEAQALVNAAAEEKARKKAQRAQEAAQRALLKEAGPEVSNSSYLTR